MKEKTPPRDSLDFFRSELSSILDLRHELCILANKVDWERFENRFAGYFVSAVGNPALPARLVVGILYLKHAFGLSDEEVVAKWCENPYWQYFCGMKYFQHELPMHPTSLVKWRQRLGEAGSELLLQELIEVGLRMKVIEEKDLKQVVVDTTVQEKAISFPTDAKLQHRARVLLVKEAKKRGLELRQSYERKGKEALVKGNRYASAKQMKRARKEFKKIKNYLGCVTRNIERELKRCPELRVHFEALLEKSNRLLRQQKADKNKLYSLHAPEVECIAKGKAHKKYEFGVKTSVVMTIKKNFVLGMQALSGNPYDGHTLVGALDQVERLTGKRPETSFVDLGYRGHGETQSQVYHSRTKTKLRSLKKLLRRRNAIEPIIGHMKSDGWLGRNYLKGNLGDKINALMSGSGHNLRLILRIIRLFWLWIWYGFKVYLNPSIAI